jgi:hypothetical protein
MARQKPHVIVKVNSFVREATEGTSEGTGDGGGEIGDGIEGGVGFRDGKELRQTNTCTSMCDNKRTINCTDTIRDSQVKGDIRFNSMGTVIKFLTD